MLVHALNSLISSSNETPILKEKIENWIKFNKLNFTKKNLNEKGFDNFLFKIFGSKWTFDFNSKNKDFLLKNGFELILSMNKKIRNYIQRRITSKDESSKAALDKKIIKYTSDFKNSIQILDKLEKIYFDPEIQEFFTN